MTRKKPTFLFLGVSFLFTASWSYRFPNLMLVQLLFTVFHFLCSICVRDPSPLLCFWMFYHNLLLKSLVSVVLEASCSPSSQSALIQGILLMFLLLWFSMLELVAFALTVVVAAIVAVQVSFLLTMEIYLIPSYRILRYFSFFSSILVSLSLSLFFYLCISFFLSLFIC